MQARQLKILPAQKNDFASLLAIWLESVRATHFFVSEADLRSLRREIAEIFLPAMPELWLAYLDTERAAFLACNGASLEMLFVRPNHFGKGLGSALLHHASTLHGPLTVAVNCQNEGALRFYLHNGFTIFGYSNLDGQGREYPLFYLDQGQNR